MNGDRILIESFFLKEICFQWFPTRKHEHGFAWLEDCQSTYESCRNRTVRFWPRLSTDRGRYEIERNFFRPSSAFKGELRRKTRCQGQDDRSLRRLTLMRLENRQMDCTLLWSWTDDWLTHWYSSPYIPLDSHWDYRDFSREIHEHRRRPKTNDIGRWLVWESFLHYTFPA